MTVLNLHIIEKNLYSKEMIMQWLTNKRIVENEPFLGSIVSITSQYAKSISLIIFKKGKMYGQKKTDMKTCKNIILWGNFPSPVILIGGFSLWKMDKFSYL